MTSALKHLLEAHEQDQNFPYMDFLGAFLMVEKWVARSGKDLLHRFHTASTDDLLGLPLGDSLNDLKLGFVLSLLRSHAQEVYQSTFESDAAILN